MAEITPGRAYGFFTDTSVCIGCKACEVACKEWNLLDGNAPLFGDGYDNSRSLDAQNWRHVQFIDKVPDEKLGTGQGTAWLMMSDVCKHCQHASCMEVCPTGAIIRTEFDTVYIQPDVCNGCRDCIAACPYDVIALEESKGVVQKCTLCYDRLQGGMEPACAKACPTDSIQFGPLDELRTTARQRLDDLHGQGVGQARLYGDDDSVYGGLNAFFLLMDEPEAYKLPNAENAVLPRRNNRFGYLGVLGTAVLGVLGGLIALRRRREPVAAAAPAGGAAGPATAGGAAGPAAAGPATAQTPPAEPPRAAPPGSRGGEPPPTDPPETRGTEGGER